MSRAAFELVQDASVTVTVTPSAMGRLEVVAQLELDAIDVELFRKLLVGDARRFCVSVLRVMYSSFGFACSASLPPLVEPAAVVLSCGRYLS